MNDTPARQMIGKVPPRRLATREATNLDTRCLQLGGILAKLRSDFLKLQFHLIDQPLAALGARTEHLALHLGDHQLQVLDQRLRAGEPGARLDQRRLQRIYVVGELIRCRRHESTESQTR